MTGTSEHGERLNGWTETVIIAPNGLGFGEGSISTKKQIENGQLTERSLQRGVDLLPQEAARLFKQVESNDDGCGDGRPTLELLRYVHHQDSGEFVAESVERRLRAKVFGGGLVVAASMMRNLYLVPQDGTVLDDRKAAAAFLDNRGISFGAHTDIYAHGESCGCGAIDKSPEIAANALRYKSEITGVLQSLYGNSFADNEEAIAAVFAGYEAQKQSYFADAEGGKTMDLIKREGAVIKKLGGDHQEDVIVLNDIPGTTFDQQEYDAVLKEREVEGTVQAFVVDVWRGRMYAKLVADFAAELAQQEDEQASAARSDEEYTALQEQYQRQAMADFLVRTLAVSGTLTGGDLPVVSHGMPRAERRDLALEA